MWKKFRIVKLHGARHPGTPRNTDCTIPALRRPKAEEHSAEAAQFRCDILAQRAAQRAHHKCAIMCICIYIYMYICYYIILYCIISYQIRFYCIMLYHIILHDIIVYYIFVYHCLIYICHYISASASFLRLSYSCRRVVDTCCGLSRCQKEQAGVVASPNLLPSVLSQSVSNIIVGPETIPSSSKLSIFHVSL